MSGFFFGLFSFCMKWVLSCFMPNKDEKLGALEATVKAQEKVIKDVQVKQSIDSRIDNASSADLDKLCSELDAADK